MLLDVIVQIVHQPYLLSPSLTPPPPPPPPLSISLFLSLSLSLSLSFRSFHLFIFLYFLLFPQDFSHFFPTFKWSPWYFLHNTNAINSVKRKTCDEECVSETLRALQVRAKEHRDAICLGNTELSAKAQHVYQQKEPHEIDWKTMSAIDRAQAQQEQKLREAIKIHQRQPKMNRDAGLDDAKTWHSIL